MDESRFNAFTMESFQGLGKNGEKLVDQLAVHGTGGGNPAYFITAVVTQLTLRTRWEARMRVVRTGGRNKCEEALPRVALGF